MRWNVRDVLRIWVECIDSVTGETKVGGDGLSPATWAQQPRLRMRLDSIGYIVKLLCFHDDDDDDDDGLLFVLSWCSCRLDSGTSISHPAHLLLASC